MNKVSPEQSDGEKVSFLKLTSFLRFPLACFVVAIHWTSGANCIALKQLVGYEIRGVVPVFNFFYNAAITCAVPLFFLISGYLLFANVETGRFSCSVYKTKLRRRFRSLFVPYVIWNLLAFLLHPFYGFMETGVDMEAYFLTLADRLHEQGWHIFWDVSTVGTYHYPQLLTLWFVRDLIVIVCCMPVFYLLFRPCRNRFLSIAKLVVFLVSMLLLDVGRYWPFEIGLTWRAVFWFGLGAAISLQKLERGLSKVLIVAPFMVALGYAALWLVQILPGSSVWSQLEEVAKTVLYLGIFMVAWLLQRQTAWTFPSDYTKSSFFIYCWHLLPCLGIQAWLRLLFKELSWTGLSYHSPLFLAVLVLPPLIQAFAGVYVYKLWRRFSPGTAGVMLGSR